MREFTINNDGQAMFKDGGYWLKVIAPPLGKELSKERHQAILAVLNGDDSASNAQSDASERMAEAIDAIGKAYEEAKRMPDYASGWIHLCDALVKHWPSLQAYKETKK